MGILLSIIVLLSPSYLLAKTTATNGKSTDFCNQNKSTEVIYCNDFEDDQLGIYTSENLNKDWPNLQSLSDKINYSSLGITQKRVKISEFSETGNNVADKNNQNNKNQVLEILYPKNQFGPWLTGATWNMQLSKLDQKKSYEQLSFEYKVKFKKGFLFTRDGLFGGKLPGLMGGETISGGATADGRNGWTSRLMWGQKGRGLGYLYYPDMKDDKHNQKACPRYGLDHELCVIKRNKYFSFEENSDRKCLSEWAADEYEFRFDTGRFYKIKQYLKMNTLPDAEDNGDKSDSNTTKQGNRDGKMKIWLDDKLVLDCTNIRFRDIPELAIDSLIFSTFFGGNTPESSAHPHDETLYFDDFIVRTK